jgi:hypothetical protein
MMASASLAPDEGGGKQVSGSGDHVVSCVVSGTPQKYGSEQPATTPFAQDVA